MHADPKPTAQIGAAEHPLRKARVKRGMSQEDLAAAADVDRATIIRAEAGSDLRVSTALALAAAAGSTVEAIWGTQAQVRKS